jgi:hypothetical protein
MVGVLSSTAAACRDNDKTDFYIRRSAAWGGGGTSAVRLSTWLGNVVPGTTASTTATALNTAFYHVLNNTSSVAILSIDIYPKPSTGFVQVILESPSGYSRYDLSGKRKRIGPFDQIENQLNIKNISSGIYFLKVEDGNRTLAKKISKI